MTGAQGWSAAGCLAGGAQATDRPDLRTGGRSVPRVFVDSVFIGGGDDTAAKARSGELKQLLTAKGII